MHIAWWRILVLVPFLVICCTDVAWAHAEISPEEVAAGGTEEFTLKVEQELDVPTTEVRMEVPDGFVVSSPEGPSGWQANVEGNAVVWSGGEIAPEEDAAEFTFEARAPQETGEYAWKVFQTYEDGEVVEWTGPEDAEEPAAFVNVTSSDSQKNADSDADMHEAGDDHETHAETTTGSGILPGSGGLDPLVFFGGLGIANVAALVLTTLALVLLLRMLRR